VGDDLLTVTFVQHPCRRRFDPNIAHLLNTEVCRENVVRNAISQEGLGPLCGNVHGIYRSGLSAFRIYLPTLFIHVVKRKTSVVKRSVPVSIAACPCPAMTKIRESGSVWQPGLRTIKSLATTSINAGAKVEVADVINSEAWGSSNIRSYARFPSAAVRRTLWWVDLFFTDPPHRKGLVVRARAQEVGIPWAISYSSCTVAWMPCPREASGCTTAYVYTGRTPSGSEAKGEGAVHALGLL
jgi:hypothetical protein